MLVACNLSDQVVHRDWGCPHVGSWEVVLDTDSPDYGGEGAAGASSFLTNAHDCDFFPNSLSFAVGQWSVRILAFQG